MRAIVHHRYGGPEVLEVADLPVPTPGSGQVLVRVHAAALNAADWRLMSADPFLARVENGWLRPRKWPVLGSDFSGVVAAIGEGVDDISVGDAVFGDSFTAGRAAFADYVCVERAMVVAMPAALSFAAAASAPLAGVTAIQAIRLSGRVQPDASVLIYGAGGGVGSVLTQLCVALGARVAVVCGPRSIPLVERYGVDRIIDYTAGAVVLDDSTYDTIFAVNGHRRPAVYRRALRPGGGLVIIGGKNRQIFEGLLLAPLVFLFSGKMGKVLTIDDAHRSEDLRTLAAHLADGTLQVDIDRSFALDEARDAFRYMLGGHVQGKIVLDVAA
ncbi:MAG: NAD(P)-dependent alcohol dehydrogenase [Myxococcota bacterium]